MKPSKAILSAVALALGMSASASALAWHHGGQARFGVYIGAPGYWNSPFYYPPYYPSYYYPPAVITQTAPPVYVEQGGAQAQESWWYYCAEAKAYYPYVKDCPAGWQRIAPLPQQ